MKSPRLLLVPLVALMLHLCQLALGEEIRLGTFAVDASPPVGSPLAYDPMKELVMPLSARGVVLLGDEKPIVLCAVDWIGIGGGGQDVWREAIAEAAGTTVERVSVHALHQHDAPRCDFSAEALLAKHGLSGKLFDPAFARRVVESAAQAVRKAVKDAMPVTHIGLGQAKVEKIASNRRIMGPDGKVRAVRWTATRDPELRALPEGVIDPFVKLIAFYEDERPLVVLSYYATHPQSYYRTGGANPDFPGIARSIREKATGGLTHVYFTGAAGNIGAGKYNDGSHENRQILADRLAQGIADAWEAIERTPVTADDLDWRVEPVALPVGGHLNEAKLAATLADAEASESDRKTAAVSLSFLRRSKAGRKIDLVCLAIGKARVVHLPGEPVVEYQLAAQKMRPDLFVAVAGYSDYSPGYICLKEHYSQGGYESSNRASRVAPEVEDALMPAIGRLLK